MRSTLLTFLILLSLSLSAQFNPQGAYSNSRGCIVCEAYAVGDSFSLDNGNNWYYVVERPQLKQLRDQGADLSLACVSLVTDMSSLFEGFSSFNQNISNWDVSQVTDMSNMFLGATAFNQNISNWDTDTVIDMGKMFRDASSFNQNINSWDVSQVTDMRYMFFFAASFNQDLNNWDVSQVTNMYSMFFGASSFNGDITNWNVGQVSEAAKMFREASNFNRDISGWTFGPVTELYGMFRDADSFNQNINAWDVSGVTDFSGMFQFADNYNQPLSNWDMSNAQRLNRMFYDAPQFNQDITAWNVGSATNMYKLFRGTPFNFDISNWNVSSVTNMGAMFQNAINFNQDISNWDVDQVTDMNAMFFGATNFSQDISGWCASSIISTPNNFSINSGLQPAQLPIWGTCNFSPPSLDSVVVQNHNSGIYRAFFSNTLSYPHRLEFKEANASNYTLKTFGIPGNNSQKFNITPNYNSTMMIRLAVEINGIWRAGDSLLFQVDCKPMTLQMAEQKAAFCEGDSALVRVGFAGGYGAKSILWSNGATTKRAYAQQGETLLATITDASGCQAIDSITATVLSVATAPQDYAVSRNGALITGIWKAPSLSLGQSLIGYRMSYRLRNSGQPWTNSALTTDTFQTIDWTNSGIPAGNYEFVVFARYNENGTPTNSNFSCIDVLGYNGIGGKRDLQSTAVSENTLRVYPNPTRDIVTVESALGKQLRLLDLQGKVLISQELQAGLSTLDLEHLSKGIYLLEVLTEEGEIMIERVIKN